MRYLIEKIGIDSKSGLWPELFASLEDGRSSFRVSLPPLTSKGALMKTNQNWIPSLEVFGLLALLVLSACAESVPTPEPDQAPAETVEAEEPSQGVGTDPRQAVLYAESLFCDEDTSEAQLQALQGAGFTAINLFTLRIGEDGDLRTCNRPRGFLA